MRVYRVYRARHRATAFDGAGAKLAGARWNLPGTAMVYTCATLSLCVLELFVHLDPETIDLDALALEYRWADVPDAWPVLAPTESELPRDWSDLPWPSSTQRAGTHWMSEGHPVVAVPSVIVPLERNYLLNPAASRFREIRLGPPAPLRLDARLFGR